MHHNPARSVHFNPRAYVRHDLTLWQQISSREFQSTCLREARPSRRRDCDGRRHFNPRAYVRHDEKLQLIRDMFAFQSTCLREARLSCVWV